MSYRPAEPFSTAVELLNVTGTEDIQGVDVDKYEAVGIIMCSFKTFGGTESNINGVLTVADTANIETWYRPDITSASKIKLGTKVYEVIGEPEDIEQRHQYLMFKVRGVKGGT